MRAATTARPLAVPGLYAVPVTVVLLAAAGACWIVTVARMQGMDMGPGTDLGGLGWFAGVWVTMMAAMMLPSLVPMASAFAIGERDGRAGSPGATTLFVLGYLIPWVIAGVVAYGAIQGIRGLDPGFLAWDQAGPYVAGAVIIGAGLYELSPAKAVSLSHCRDPRSLIAQRRPGPMGAARTGVAHGGFCVGCCWALMAALFALGVMSIAWMVLVTVLVAADKLLPWRALATRGTAVLLVVLGVAVALSPGLVPGLTIPM